jgi:RHS repeat-associated protein
VRHGQEHNTPSNIRTWYIRDASGNVLSVYEKPRNLPLADLVQKEIPLYGSSRLGLLNVQRFGPTLAKYARTRPNERRRGDKFFEMSNHLGNVLTVVNDQLFGRDASSTTSATNVWYESKVVSYSDYLPFGAQMTGRTGTSTAYRYGFNGKEKDEAGEFGTLTHYDYGFRIYSQVLGKFLSVDPLTSGYPWYTPYQFAGNMPVWAVDVDGLEPERSSTSVDDYQEAAHKETGYDAKWMGDGAGGWEHVGSAPVKIIEKVPEFIKAAGGEKGFNAVRSHIYAQKIAAQNTSLGRSLGGSPEAFRRKAWEDSRYLAAAALKAAYFEDLEAKEFPEVDGWWLFGESYASAEIKMKYGTTEQDFQEGIGNYVFAISDIAMVKGLGKLGIKGLMALTEKSVAASGSNIWRVGAYNELKGVEVGLDAHHVGQGAVMKRLIPNYNYQNAPAILVPKVGHTKGVGVVSTKTKGFTNARQVVARDIRELRRVYGSHGIPNSSLQELIQLNKKMYPGAFIKY